MTGILPTGLQERLLALQEDAAARDRLRADREGAVRRTLLGSEAAAFVPGHPLAPRRNVVPPHLVEERGGDDVHLAGLDDDDRPVIVRRAGREDEPLPDAVVSTPHEDEHRIAVHAQLLTWDGDRVEVVHFMHDGDAIGGVEWVDLDDAGRPVRLSAITYGSQETTWCTWTGDRCTETRTVTGSGQTWTPERRLGIHGPRGLVQVLRAVGARASSPEQALAELPHLVPETIIWTEELDSADEVVMDEEAALAAWIEDLVEATTVALATAADRRGSVVARLHPAFRGQSPTLVVATLADVAELAQQVGPEQALDQVDGERIEVLQYVGPSGLEARRALLQRPFSEWDDDRYAGPLQKAFAVTGTALTLPLVVPLGGGQDPWNWRRQVLGAERAEALLRHLGPLPPAPPLPKIAPRSREELAATLDAAGLPASVADQARWGLALVGGGDGRTHLGGRPALPEGEPWPTSGGRALTHLISLDVADVPDVEGRELLPAEGTLVLFADLTEDGALHEPVVVGEDDRVRLRLIAPGTRTHEPMPPRDDRDEYDSPAVLKERRLRLLPVLVPAADPHGLSEAARDGYERFYQAILELTPELEQPGHVLLGRPIAVQEDPAEEGEVPLLSLTWDEDLGFTYLDGGTLTLVGREDDLRAERWDRLVLHPDSC